MQLRIPTAADVADKTVLLRVDYNVPLKNEGGVMIVEDDQRLRASLPMINFLLENRAKVVLISHLGRPEGKQAELSLRPIAEYLRTQLQLPVTFVGETVGNSVKEAVTTLQPSSVLLLENIRFYPEEEQNDATFAQQLASLADVYINDAFSVSHRAHASTEGVTHFLPSFAGFSLQKEVETLGQLLTNPKRPFFVIVGGAKISDKVDALTNLAHIADGVLLGGGVANDFLKAEGLEIHHSYLQDTPADLQKKGINYVQVAEHLIESTKTERVLKDGYIPLPKIIYPVDVVAAASPDSTDTQVIDLTHDAQDTPNDKDLMYLDIGPKTAHLYTELIKQAGSVFWNGPMGFFEKTPFKAGTTAVAQAIAECGAMTVIGGGDTITAAQELGLENTFTFVSTAGSASLEFLGGAQLPGLTPLIVSST